MPYPDTHTCWVGIDTSNYTTSVSLAVREPDAPGRLRVVSNRKAPLPVAPGARGLRQSDALFAHTRNLPELMRLLRADIRGAGIPLRTSYRAEKDRVRILAFFHPLIGDRNSELIDGASADIDIGILKAVSVLRGDSVEHLDRLSNNFRAYPVAGKDCDPLCHFASSFNDLRSPPLLMIF